MKHTWGPPHEVFAQICHILRSGHWNGPHGVLVLALAVLFNPCVWSLSHKNSELAATWLTKAVTIWVSSKTTRRWTREVNSIRRRKAFLYPPSLLTPSPTHHPPPFLVRSSDHEYRAQITSRLNKVFSLPLEQRPFWRPRGRDVYTKWTAKGDSLSLSLIIFHITRSPLCLFFFFFYSTLDFYHRIIMMSSKSWLSIRC